MKPRKLRLGLSSRRLLLPAILCTGLALGPAATADPVRTGKERLGDKASDEQRVDDCKVPQARRTRPRPASCPWDSGHEPDGNKIGKAPR